MSICIRRSRSRFTKLCCIIAVLLLLLALVVVTFTVVNLFRGNSNHIDDNNENEDDDPPTDLSCEYLTRTRLYEQYWDCLTYGPTKFMLPLEREKMDAQRPVALQINDMKKNPNKNNLKKNSDKNGRGARVKRSVLHVPYLLIEPVKYTLEIEPVTSEGKSSRSRANDPYFYESPFLWKYDNSGKIKQLPPPWSYKGNFGVNRWHELHLEKFLVPVNPKLDLNKEDRLLRAVFSDLWDEYKFLYKDENGFQDALFNGLTPDERQYMYRMLYGVPYKDARLNKNRAFDVDLPAIFKRPEITDASGHYIDPKMRVLKDNSVYNPDGHNFTQLGYYSFMRFFMEHRPDSETYEKFKHLIHPALRASLPAKGANFRRIQRLYEKLDEKYNAEHKLTDQENKMVELMNKIAINLKYKINDENNDTEKQTPNKNVLDWIVNTFEKSQVDQETDQSKYSVNVFPYKFPICQDKEPSPLNIITKNAKQSSLLSHEFDDNGYRFYRFILTMPPDGTSILGVSLEGASRTEDGAIELKRGASKGLQLFFESLHIKYGNSVGGVGSEHLLDGKSYDMELQFLFSYRGIDDEQPYYFTLARQLNDLFPYRDKMVQIVSVFVQVDPTLEEKSYEGLIFEGLAQTIYAMREQIEKDPTADHYYRSFQCKDYAIRIWDFFPKNSSYYIYRGGLTIPPCFSYITWSVYADPIRITPRQFTEFRLIRSPAENSGFLAGNIRTPESPWSSYEHVANILPSEAAKRKKDRDNRVVHKSFVAETAKKKGGKDDNVYDYYHDYSKGRQILKPTPSIIVIAIIFSWIGVAFIL